MSKEFGIALKAMIKSDKGEFLVLSKSDKDEINPKQVDIPGGRMEFGENLETAIKREIKEELGINIKIGKPSRVWNMIKDDLHLVGITFNAKYIDGEVKLSFEHIAMCGS
jgi:8-oxo-dGTP diphosphatase